MEASAVRATAELRGNALVTGGSRGIGRACALTLASRGADVAISYIRNRDAAEATAEEIRALGRRALVLQGDAGDAAANAALVERTIEGLGPLRFLVSNAANGTFADVDDLTAADWDYAMAAHARALLVLSQRASLSMRESGGGSIVAISSLGARRVYDAYAAFGAAKAAIEALGDWEALAAASADRSPLRTVLDPEDVAASVAFLLSDEAHRVTGQALVVDAGFTLGG